MKLDEMKVQYEKSRDGFSKESAFTVQSAQKSVRTDASGIVIKIGLCAAVLILAFIIRAVGVGSQKNEVVTASANGGSAGAAAAGESNDAQIGSLHYVETGAMAKWNAPVVSNDIELLRDGQLLRFTANSDTVTACMSGKVLSVGEEEPFGKSVRIQSDADVETLYYGFSEVSVKEGQTVQADDILGSVERGRSIYFKVLERGEPQDPTGYVDLSLHQE